MVEQGAKDQLMFDTVIAQIDAWRTNPLVEEINITGVDLTGATIRMEVRDRADGGALRAGLDNVGSLGTEGVHIAVDTSGDDDITTLTIRINESTMEAIPVVDPGEDLDIWWGMHITPSGGTKFMAFHGIFRVKASVPA